MKVVGIGVNKVKGHKGEFTECAKEDCLKEHVFFLDAWLEFDDTAVWQKGKVWQKYMAGEHTTVESANAMVDRVAGELQEYLKDEEKPRVCYCFGPNATQCPVHSKVVYNARNY